VSAPGATRLESFIVRLQAQRACLDDAALRIADRPGVVLELGLGNGRTYDHLRKRLPDRAIFVFERQVSAHPQCVPDAEHLFSGDLADTLPLAAARFPAGAVFVHADLGTADPQRNARLYTWLGPALEPVLADEALLICDQRLEHAAYHPMSLPEGVAAGRYFYYRYAGSGRTAG
jgi:hypothetical protein